MRGDKRINEHSRISQFDWRYVSGAQPVRFNDSNGTVGVAISYVSDLRSYAVPNARDQERAVAAINRLIAACKAPPPRPAAPVAAAPAPRPLPQPAPAPKSGFYYVDRAAGHCESYRVRRLLIAGSTHATAQIQARGSETYNRLVLSQGGIATLPPTQPMDNNIFLLTRSAPDAKLSASIDFDGRPAGTFSVSSGYGNENGNRQRRIYLPADFLDRLATVQVMTVTLRSGRTVTDTYVFDVASARFIRPDLARMNWRCTGAE